MNGSVDILIFEKNEKKSKFKSQYPNKHLFSLFSEKLTKKWSFFRSGYFNFLKNAPEYIDPSGHLIFYEVFCSEIFFLLFR